MSTNTTPEKMKFLREYYTKNPGSTVGEGVKAVRKRFGSGSHPAITGKIKKEVVTASSKFKHLPPLFEESAELTELAESIKNKAMSSRIERNMGPELKDITKRLRELNISNISIRENTVVVQTTVSMTVELVQ